METCIILSVRPTKSDRNPFWREEPGGARSSLTPSYISRKDFSLRVRASTSYPHTRRPCDENGNKYKTNTYLQIQFVIQYNTIQYNTIQYNTIQYNTIQYNTIQYNTIQYNTIQHNTTQHNNNNNNTINSNS
ncbi:hypothetical protein THAOC_33408 [Thalassiosira oceanica]|uniref:Uncharacterized protein n=1 Tax=Thalassiosira oceanica TaxID=159749 RepID=K0R479_THAOC|nr:hypothetical protein THAOC_33408 [Thalassiosira oceanica]|eukprot:EJK47848.1 hypothetical protein THAOC_33408 [Thalassiosira oceanica]